MSENYPRRQLGENSYAHLGDVTVEIDCELGRRVMSLEDAASLREGDVIELDKLAGEPFDIRVNGQRFAEGEIVVLTDLMAVRVTRLVPLTGVDPSPEDKA